MKKFLTSTKAKFLVLASLGTAAFADGGVSYSKGSGFSGEFDLTPFYSAVGIVIGAIAVVVSVKLAISMFRRV